MSVIVKVIDNPLNQCDEPPTLTFKIGDTFMMDFALTDYNSSDAQQAQEALNQAYEDLKVAEAAIPPDLPTIAAAEADIATNEVVLHDALVVDISGWIITSEVRWKGRFICPVVVSVYSPTEGGFALRIESALTELWQPRVYSLDIQFVNPSLATTVSSQTLLIDVEKDIYHV